eukprot:536170-Amphidinium_carterae.1
MTGPILRRNAILAQRRRDDGPDGVAADEGVTKQYLKYLTYHKVTKHSAQKRENMSTSSQKPFTITAECYSTS